MTEMPGGTPSLHDRIPILGGSCGAGVASPDDRGGAAVLPGTYSMGAPCRVT